jgi:hypothetical protein
MPTDVAPQIFVGGTAPGFHNENLVSAAARVKRSKAYKDSSTVCVIPTRGAIPARVVDSWFNLMQLMNQKYVRWMVAATEIGDAYSNAVDTILAHPELSQYQYLLTLEEDNMPPPDGLVRLVEAMNEERHYAAVGGLYWTKGEGGMPMIYGDPSGMIDFMPQIPVPESVQECNGLGMGFTLFRLDVFRDERVPRPFFKTLNDWSMETGGVLGTQDLYFFKNIRELGYRVACDTRVKVGHYDPVTDMVW